MPPRTVTALPYSKGQIDRAGDALRDSVEAWAAGQRIPAERREAAQNAVVVVERFRAHHAKPLSKVNAGLRYYIRQCGMNEPDVTQRLKRFGTIVDKLSRHPGKLSRMEDIGGVRAILENQQQASDIADRLRRRWNIRRERRYIDGGEPGPKCDGYRAVHVIVEKDSRFVEVQLRTPLQDRWAQSVERDTRRLSEGLKFGAGPDDLRNYYRLVSDLFAVRDRGTEPGDEFMNELAASFDAVREFFPRAAE